MTMLSPIPCLVLTLLLLLVGVNGQFQSDNCILARSGAIESTSKDQCGCPTQPTCTRCTEGAGFAIASCDSTCTYCDKANTTCGTFGYSVAYADSLLAVKTIIVDYSWEYTTGPRNGTTISYRRVTGQGCTAKLKNQTCQSCTVFNCGNRTENPTIDCSNVEAGAKATACSGRSGAGPVSLTSTEEAGALAPLAWPFWGCLQNTTVLGGPYPSTVPTASLPTPPSASPPTPTPPSASPPTTPTASPPTAPNAQPCGILGLSIFCIRGCGLIRRILGLCQN